MIARPELASQGCKFVLKADKATYEAGDSPIFEVTATNTTKQDLKAKVWINVSAVAPTNPMSPCCRTRIRSRQQEVTFSLEPGETRTQKVACAANLPAGQSVSITLGDKQETIMPMNVPVTSGPNAGPAGGPNAAQRGAGRKDHLHGTRFHVLLGVGLGLAVSAAVLRCTTAAAAGDRPPGPS